MYPTTPTQSVQHGLSIDLKSHKVLSWSDVHVDDKLGEGTFCSVHRIHMKTPNPELDHEESYALKCVTERPSGRGKTDNHDHTYSAAEDLAREAEVLAKLDHENIIKCYGVVGKDITVGTKSHDLGMGVILEPLRDTLQDRLNRWRKQKSSTSYPFNILGSKRTHKTTKQDQISRIHEIAIGIANGMAYLHKSNLVMRDLKPANVGFDNDGMVRIFDFGLSRYAKEDGSPSVSSSGPSGTFRYMAPEAMAAPKNGRGVTIGPSSDVYSFGILLWELCTLEKPYDDLASSKRKLTIPFLVQRVAEENWRPSLRSIHSSRVRALIERCWDANPMNRPTFDQISTELSVIARDEKDQP